MTDVSSVLFSRVTECLLKYFPDFEINLMSDLGERSIEVENIKQPLDVEVLAHLVQETCGHVRDIEIRWIDEPESQFALTIALSSAPLTSENIVHFTPEPHPRVTLFESLQSSGKLDMRNLPDNLLSQLPYFETALDCIYSRGADISVPLTWLFPDEDEEWWLKVTNMDSLSYSFLEYMTSTRCCSKVILQPEEQTLFVKTESGKNALSLPPRV